MSLRDLEEYPLPTKNSYHVVIFVSPGGVACKPFSDGYLTMRVCLGHIHDPEDGLELEVDQKREPIPWESEAVRNEAIAELKRRAKKSTGYERSKLIAMLQHVRGTAYFQKD